MGRLYKVADGIMDSAASEYRSINLENVQAVLDYASSADIRLTRAEAEVVLEVCQKVDGREMTSWYHDFEKPLNEAEEQLGRQIGKPFSIILTFAQRKWLDAQREAGESRANTVRRIFNKLMIDEKS